ncbi:hypothetical protein L8C07_19175 [Paenibacillus sp. CMAA1739]|nr:hypothetical protein [Paenibacillus sp. CMAA1739]
MRNTAFLAVTQASNRMVDCNEMELQRSVMKGNSSAIRYAG